MPNARVEPPCRIIPCDMKFENFGLARQAQQVGYYRRGRRARNSPEKNTGREWAAEQRVCPAAAESRTSASNVRARWRHSDGQRLTDRLLRHTIYYVARNK